MKKLTATLRYLLSIHILALTILSFFRLILFIANMQQVAEAEDKSYSLMIAMLKGVQFDNMVGCYLLALPAVVLLIFSLFNRMPQGLVKGFNIYFIVGYTVIFGISVADIPYFSYFYTHLGGSILNWVGFGGTGGMILQESSYYVYFGLYLVLIVLFGIAVFYFGRRLINGNSGNLQKKDYKYYIPLVLIVWGLCFIGMRGRLGRYPLRVSGAYFCSNSFFNQLGVNPAFYLLKSSSSFMKKKDKLTGIISDKEAIAYVQGALAMETIKDVDYPISRDVVAEGEVKESNVVIILLESMASEYLKREYDGQTLTPYIHSLIDKSYYFENFYSAGIHTNNGIASTLYGFPPIFERTMMPVAADYYTGLPVTLKDAGYQTFFFLTHDPQYDNMYSSLSENGFDNIYSQYDYPSSKVVNNFGVQDDYLLEFGLDKLNDASKSGKPFFATFMTVSNHPPYVIPERFRVNGKSDEECILSFTDNSLKDFMEAASKEDWYKNTIFVLLGDHGRVQGKQLYEMPLTYNHIPLIIYSPEFEDMPKRLNQFGGQIDVFPTVMGLLNRPYENNSLGIDLFKEKRPYAYFVSDNTLGCIDDKYFYIYNPETKIDGLYDYRNENVNNLKPEHLAVADSMKNYAVSMMLTADYLVKNKLTRPILSGSKR